MPGRLRFPWLTWLLFRLTLLLAGVLVLLVVICPLFDVDGTRPAGWHLLVKLFAQDVSVRRTALASAIGLIVTAAIFFRAGRLPRIKWRKSSRQPPPPTGVAGA